MCVRNLEPGQILQKCLLLKESNGEKLKRVVGSKRVKSEKEGVRGIWSPFHAKEKFQV